jgi:formylglycine-generating enzyme required for sulfatase activity/serine/threonine protein kinase
MTARQTAHPSVEVLRAFALGKSSVVPAEVVAAHLAECPDCCKVVANLPNDGFAERVKNAQPTVSLPPPDPLAATRNSLPDAPALPPPDLPPELARHAEYEVQRKLGQGGMGVVYLACNKLMDRLEVLKVVNPGLLGHPGAMDRFLQEIRSAARLQHTNVVTAYAAARLGDLLMLSMEFVDGMDLNRLVAEKGPLPVAHACHYARQAALGLQHAHEQGLVHRDIKPNNLILGRKSVVKILDFGLAKVRREEEGANTGLTGSNMMMGTPDYMAPEQATDTRGADIRADIYSLGCTLHFLLTRKPPFVARSYAEALLAHQQRRPEPVNELRPDVPERLAAVVARMLAKDPAARYQTPGEVARELAPFIKGEVQPPPPPPPKPEPTVPVGSPFVTFRSAKGQLSRDRQPFAERKATVGQSDTLPPVPEPRPPTKPPPGRGRKVGLGVAVAVVGLLLTLGVVLLLSFPGGQTKTDRTDPEPRPGGVVVGPGEPINHDKNPAAPQPGEVMAVSLPAGATMKFAWIPPGTFQMGGDQDEREKPIRRVTLTKGFYLGVYPVTQAQWRAVMNDNPSQFKGDDRPVEQVSWDDCQTFCDNLRQFTGKPMRLPTEAQWEYACRAGTTTDYYTGNGEDALRKAGWYWGNSDNQTHPVGQKARNAWGLYDMHGNVLQWCQDWYGSYEGLGETDPLRMDKSTDNARVLRGGSWFNRAWFCRAADRSGHAPSGRGNYIGFRVAIRLD